MFDDNRHEELWTNHNQARNILFWVYTENWLFKNADDAFNHLRF